MMNWMKIKNDVKNNKILNVSLFMARSFMLKRQTSFVQKIFRKK